MSGVSEQSVADNHSGYFYFIAQQSLRKKNNFKINEQIFPNPRKITQQQNPKNLSLNLNQRTQCSSDWVSTSEIRRRNPLCLITPLPHEMLSGLWIETYEKGVKTSP